MSGITPSQTVGPYFAYGLTPNGLCQWQPSDAYAWKDTVGSNLVTPDVSGERIRIEGCVTDGDGAPINDAMIEIWQADGQGRYAHPADKRALPNSAFKGFGRSATRQGRTFRVCHDQARRRAGAERSDAGAAYRRDVFFARSTDAPVYAHILFR